MRLRLRLRRRRLVGAALAGATVCALAAPGGALAAPDKTFAGKVAAQSNSGLTLTVAYSKRRRPTLVRDFRWANIVFNCDGTPRNIVGAERDFDPDVRVSRRTKRHRKQRFSFTDSGIDHLMKVTGTFGRKDGKPQIRGTLQIVDTFDGTMCDSGIVRWTARPGALTTT